MKNYIIILGLCLFALKASSQTNMTDMFPKGSEIYLKNGDKVPMDKIDSVIGSWGGKFSMMHDGNKIVLTPSTQDDVQMIKVAEAATMSKLNQPAPDFSLTDINGHDVSLQSLRGKVVVLNFWFTTCAGCISEMPELNKLEQSFEGKNVVFLAMGRDNADKIQSFLSSHEFKYQLLTNAVKTAADYNVSLYPVSMVIDKSGTIRFIQAAAGNQVAENLSSSINSLL